MYYIWRDLIIINEKMQIMKKNASVMGLNVQPENVLSKEERKARLGGFDPPPSCYVVCRGGRWLLPDLCNPIDIKSVCGEEIPKCCGCWGECYE